MKKILILLTCILIATAVNSQIIYSKAFGDPSGKPIIYLHGGPGYNSAVFEVTTAKRLAENGFYVIVYDRRGEGRSLDLKAEFTFNQTFEDLDLIYKKFDLTSATLVGHSFGGVVATLFAEKYPNKINSIVLVSTPLSMQETFKTILKSSKQIYENKKDTINLNYISMIEKMDKKSIEYSSYCFMHAIQNNFYYPKKPLKEALAIYSSFKTDTLLLKYASELQYAAPKGFLKNEKYTILKLNEDLEKLKKMKTPIFGLYGEYDGLFSKTQIRKIKKIIGKKYFKTLKNSSHNLFIDQQAEFISFLINWI